MCNKVSVVGATGVQTTGHNDHNSLVMGHGSRGSSVGSPMGQIGHGSPIVSSAHCTVVDMSCDILLVATAHSSSL